MSMTQVLCQMPEIELTKSACPGAYSLGVALQNSLVHSLLVYLGKHFSIAAGGNYRPAFGHLKSYDIYLFLK